MSSEENISWLLWSSSNDDSSSRKKLQKVINPFLYSSSFSTWLSLKLSDCTNDDWKLERKRRGKWSGKKGRFSGVCLLQGKREDRHEDSKKLLVGGRKRVLTLMKGEGRIDVTSERERDLCRLFILFMRSEWEWEWMYQTFFLPLSLLSPPLFLSWKWGLQDKNEVVRKLDEGTNGKKVYCDLVIVLSSFKWEERSDCKKRNERAYLFFR